LLGYDFLISHLELGASRNDDFKFTYGGALTGVIRPILKSDHLEGG